MSRFRPSRLTAPSWLRLPRRTARLRLTLLSGALFLLSGATLLAVIYGLFLFVRSGGSGSARSGRSSGAAATAQRFADQHDLLTACAIGLVIVAVFALLLGWFVAGRMLRPVTAITATARRISATNLDERLRLDGADEEFKQLGDTLDNLFARLAAAFDAQRHFIANASHELRSPLTRERTLIQVALGDPSTSDVWRSTGQDLLASNREQERLIEALLALASSESGLDHPERVDLAATCEDVLGRLDLRVDTFGLHVETAIGSAPLYGDPKLIERLIANLVDNAIGHNTPGGQVHISTAVVDKKATLSVTNTGLIIPAGEVNRLFQPFQRLDPSRTHHRDGHGLGLSIVRAIAAAHGAGITARPGVKGGLSVSVTFPSPTEVRGRSPRASQGTIGAYQRRASEGETPR